MTLRHPSTATSSGLVSSLSYLSRENGRIPKAFRTCPLCKGGGLVEHNSLDLDGRIERRKVSDGEARSMERLRADGMSYRRIARHFGIHFTHVGRILTGKRSGSQ